MFLHIYTSQKKTAVFLYSIGVKIVFFILESNIFYYTTKQFYIFTLLKRYINICVYVFILYERMTNF